MLTIVLALIAISTFSALIYAGILIDSKDAPIEDSFD